MKRLHVVHINKDLGYQREGEIREFVEKHLKEYGGHTLERYQHGISLLLFDREQDASKFANDMSKKLNIPREHITVRAEK